MKKVKRNLLENMKRKRKKREKWGWNETEKREGKGKEIFSRVRKKYNIKKKTEK